MQGLYSQSLDGLPLDEFFRQMEGLPFFADLKLGGRLNKIGMLKSLPPAELEKFTPRMRMRFFPAESIISKQGDYDNSVYVILQGRVQLAIQARLDKQIEFLPGSFFGESGALSGNPRTATLLATEPSLLLEIPRQAFLDLYQENPSFKKYIDQYYIARAVHTYVRQVEIFKDLTEEQFDVIQEVARLRRYPAGTVIVRQGDAGDALYLIRSGFVNVSVEREERQQTLTYIKEGNYFGEMALLTGEPRSATVRAETDTECIYIGKRDFNRILERHPEIRQKVDAVHQARVEERQSRMAKGEDGDEARLHLLKDLMEADEILAIDMNSCIRCNNCVVACEDTHGVARMSVSGDVIDDYIITSSCRHCTNPRCLQCNYDAIGRSKDGEIFFTDNCIGCGDCAKNCPYGMITMVSMADHKVNFWDRIQFWKASEEIPRKRKPTKCNLCAELPYQSCLSNCPTDAMKFISLQELMKN